jgi:hypothetical protein
MNPTSNELIDNSQLTHFGAASPPGTVRGPTSNWKWEAVSGEIVESAAQREYKKRRTPILFRLPFMTPAISKITDPRQTQQDASRAETDTRWYFLSCFESAHLLFKKGAAIMPSMSQRSVTLGDLVLPAIVTVCGCTSFSYVLLPKPQNPDITNYMKYRNILNFILLRIY